jgi:hypothetical protein
MHIFSGIKDAMTRHFLLALATAICCGVSEPALADTQVQITADFRLQMNSWTRYNFTGWDATGQKSAQPLTIYERFRERFDFIASDWVKFRFRLNIRNANWGGAMAVDNPPGSIDVSNAYLIFTVPDTGVRLDAGFQDWNIPLNPFFANAKVLGSRVAALVVTAPVAADLFSLGFGYLKPRQTYADFSPGTGGNAANFDAFYLAATVTTAALDITPWGAFGMIGRDTSPLSSVGTQMLPAIPAVAGLPASWANNVNDAFWIGSSVDVKVFSPITFYADIIYGNAAFGDHGYDNRRGAFLDAALSYSGLAFATPSLWGFWSTGDTGGILGGSERMPYRIFGWNAGNSFLFNDDHNEWYRDKLNVNQVGAWGLGFTLDKIGFATDLSHRLTVNFANGTNSPHALREGIALAGIGNSYGMGLSLASSEWVYGVECDNQYEIRKNLSLYGNLGWAHGDFDSTLWGHRFVNQAQGGDVWRIVLGLKYFF